MGNHPLFFLMKTFVKTVLLILVVTCLFISCSFSEKTQVKKEEVDTDTVYVFDEIPSEDTFEFESPIQQPIDVYVVQIGAFSSFDRAKEFADQSWTKLNKEIKVEYKQPKNLYVVWVYPPFQDKTSAEVYRNDIQKGGEFKDAWIVTVESKK
jgi:cell division septation protein DedD